MLLDLAPICTVALIGKICHRLCDANRAWQPSVGPGFMDAIAFAGVERRRPALRWMARSSALVVPSGNGLSVSFIVAPCRVIGHPKMDDTTPMQAHALTRQCISQLSAADFGASNSA